jgi:uncharacterized protein (DUF58 family)
VSDWQPTPALVRAVLLGAGGLLFAVLFHRPDVLVLSVPFVTVGLWGALGRPRTEPQMDVRVSTSTLKEGEGAAVRLDISGVADARVVVARLAPSTYLETHEPTGVVTTEIDGRVSASIPVGFRSTRWGQRPIGGLVVAAFTPWASYRWGPTKRVLPLLVTEPIPAAFDASAPPPHPRGLVGPHRSARTGEGTEFAGIRPFQPGDRLRRVHWPVSLRTGQVHVTTTYADNDSHVLLVIDASTDLGRSGGIDGAASSLDLTVRAAAAIAEHHLRTGDRVGVRLIGGATRLHVPASSGRAHLRRILRQLATMQYGVPERESALSRLGVGAGALVVMLTPLASPLALQHAVTLARRGLTVVIVDTLPAHVTGLFDDPYLEVAWRIRVLERDAELRAVQQAGLPVVQWRGPGSLDAVLRDMGRRAEAPRLGRR